MDVSCDQITIAFDKCNGVRGRQLMKKVLLTGFICLSLASGAFGATKTASLEAASRSLYQTPLSWVAPGIGTIVTFFTTYDGASGLPLFDATSTNFSAEVRPRAGQANTFEADYLNLNGDIGIVAYGSTTFSILNNDSDQNTLPDVFEFKKASTVAYIGTIQSDFPSVIHYTTRGTFTKQAGQYSTSNTTIVSDPNGVVVLQGTADIRLGYFSGVATYTRGAASAQTMDLTLTGVLFDTIPVTYTATTPFTVVNADTVSLPAFVARQPNGVSIQVFAATLNRKGKKYVAEFEINDGNFSTSWRDYTKWVLELTDSNDADGNGIPDLSDLLATPPTFTVQPLSGNYPAGTSFWLSATATGTPAPTYQWQHNGTNLTGANLSTLTINNAQAINAGQYRVIASNSAGSIPSKEASVTVITTPGPRLVISSEPRKKIRISWPATAGNFVVEYKPNPSAFNWNDFHVTPVDLNSEKVLILNADLAASLFRLRRSP
jgi:hypothetical protein